MVEGFRIQQHRSRHQITCQRSRVAQHTIWSEWHSRREMDLKQVEWLPRRMMRTAASTMRWLGMEEHVTTCDPQGLKGPLTTTWISICLAGISTWLSLISQWLKLTFMKYLLSIWEFTPRGLLSFDFWDFKSSLKPCVSSSLTCHYEVPWTR